MPASEPAPSNSHATGYPAPNTGMRLAISRAIIVESSRGWRLDKLKQAHKIDVIVALSLGALAAIRSEGSPCIRTIHSVS